MIYHGGLSTMYYVQEIKSKVEEVNIYWESEDSQTKER
jgi:hypothetical protein